MASLDLGAIGNCEVAGLVDRAGGLVRLCLPRLDGDPVFHALLGPGPDDPADGAFRVELEDLASVGRAYEDNTPVLRTVLHGASGSVEITDFAPRCESRDRVFRPRMLIRRVAPVSGLPRVRLRLRPRVGWGAQAPALTRGSNHVTYSGAGQALRVTTNAAIDHLLSEALINLDGPLVFLIGVDEAPDHGPLEVCEDCLARTLSYWRRWTRGLAVPLEWQAAMIRAAITLKLCSYEPTGAIVAALTTSIPEAPETERNWDYRFCWVRDAFFTVRAPNSLATVRTLENYFGWLMNVVNTAREGHLQPVFGIGGQTELTERIAPALQGYRGHAPVRVGNQAHEHFQHDTYGAIVLGAAPALFDRRLLMNLGADAFARLEPLGEQAWRLHASPDAGIWELRTRARVHTSSSVMCWAGCDRLAKIATHLGLRDRAAHWRGRADAIERTILENAWSEERGAFVESFGGRTLDASVLLMGEVGFIPPDDPRFAAAVDALSRALGRGPFMMRDEEPDDFGAPRTGFNVCAFWRIDALARLGRREEAREIFEALLVARTPLGLMSEDTEIATGEPWGNFAQTYSMVGIVNGAMRLSDSRESRL